MSANDKDFQAYAIGFSIGHNLSGNGIEELNLDRFKEGVATALSNKMPEEGPEEINAAVETLLQGAQAAKAAGAIQAGSQFLEANAKRDEVTVLDSGLQYEVLQSGEGKTPGEMDSVTTHYHGTLVSGEIFDSSVQRGEPATFPVNGVIAGWTEALQMMKEGDKWRLAIPPELAYGEQNAGSIPPHSTLVFDVELLSVN